MRVITAAMPQNQAGVWEKIGVFSQTPSIAVVSVMMDAHTPTHALDHAKEYASRRGKGDACVTRALDSALS